MSQEPLKYLFQCTYNDGTVYSQNPEDKSIIDPEKRSCYYDIDPARIGMQPKSFFLYNDKNTFSVNLEDGHFEVNGVPFFMHEDLNLKDFRLIFFRRHTHGFNQNKEELLHNIVYRFGWQTNDKNGENIQEIMEIN